MRILIIDNYDSFTWNLHHLIVSEGVVADVYRNDEVFPAGVVHYDGLILSPGPGLPDDAGQLMRIITVASAHSIPMLGVCLGMQAIVEHYGGTLKNLDEVIHGRSTTLKSMIFEGVFSGLKMPCVVGHYHSWVIEELELPSNLEVTAWNEQGLVMAMRHRTLPIEAVQFHPESVLTPQGPQMLRNWLDNVKSYRSLNPVVPSVSRLWMDPTSDD